MNRCGGDVVVFFEVCLMEVMSSIILVIVVLMIIIQIGRFVVDKERIVFGVILVNFFMMFDVVWCYQ